MNCGFANAPHTWGISLMTWEPLSKRLWLSCLGITVYHSRLLAAMYFCYRSKNISGSMRLLARLGIVSFIPSHFSFNTIWQPNRDVSVTPQARSIISSSACSGGSNNLIWFEGVRSHLVLHMARDTNRVNNSKYPTTLLWSHFPNWQCNCMGSVTELDTGRGKVRRHTRKNPCVQPHDTWNKQHCHRKHIPNMISAFRFRPQDLWEFVPLWQSL